MTGTSIDALDAALVHIQGAGLDMSARFIRGLSHPLGSLAGDLRSLAEQRPATAGQIARISRDFALLHAGIIKELLSTDRADLISVHGQTIFHQPPLSWQLFNAPVLAHACGSPVVTDLRAADLASGGQGAPITPLADWIFFRSERPTAVVNLGGFCNITLLPSTALGTHADIKGLDVCACNHILDLLARELLDRPFDHDGLVALSGSIHGQASTDLIDILARQSRSGRSLGTGDETAEWIARWRAIAHPADLCASACHALASTIAQHTQNAQRVLIAGGGVRNSALTRSLRSLCAGQVQRTDDANLPADYREAAEMAVLGAMCADRVPITLPNVTHVSGSAPIAGVWSTP